MQGSSLYNWTICYLTVLIGLADTDPPYEYYFS